MHAARGFLDRNDVGLMVAGSLFIQHSCLVLSSFYVCSHFSVTWLSTGMVGKVGK